MTHSARLVCNEHVSGEVISLVRGAANKQRGPQLATYVCIVRVRLFSQPRAKPSHGGLCCSLGKHTDEVVAGPLANADERRRPVYGTTKIPFPIKLRPPPSCLCPAEIVDDSHNGDPDKQGKGRDRREVGVELSPRGRESADDATQSSESLVRDISIERFYKIDAEVS